LGIGYRQLQDQLFGRKSESSATIDRSDQLDDPDDTPEPQHRGQRRGRPGPKRRDYRHLPPREDLREIPESQRVCPVCGLPLTACSAEESEQIEFETIIYRRIIRRRRYQRTSTCPGPRTATAPGVPKLISKGRLGVSMWVEILLDKYLHDHSPSGKSKKWDDLHPAAKLWLSQDIPSCRTRFIARVGLIDRRAQSLARCFGVSDRRALGRPAEGVARVHTHIPKSRARCPTGPKADDWRTTVRHVRTDRLGVLRRLSKH
jgi:hypothetical protein